MDEKEHNSENSRPRRTHRTPRHHTKRFYHSGARERQPDDEREHATTESGANAAATPPPSAGKANNQNGVPHNDNAMSQNDVNAGAPNGGAVETAAPSEQHPAPQVLNLSELQQKNGAGTPCVGRFVSPGGPRRYAQT